MTAEDANLIKRSKKKRRDTGSKARAKARRRAVAAAIAADIWIDREGKARPTPERKAKGAFVLRETEDAGVTCAVDTATTALDRLQASGAINTDQCQAGHDFSALMERTRLVGQGRSCLDFSPVGHEDDAPPSHGELRDIEERREIYLACGSLTFAVLRRTCCDGLKPADLPRLRDGLDICVAMWKGR